MNSPYLKLLGYLLIFMTLSLSAQNDWDTSTSGQITYTGGNVGIGTTTPTAKLDVENGDLYVGQEVSANGQRRQLRVYGYDNNAQYFGTIHANWEDSKRTFDIYTNSYTNQIKIDASANNSGNILLIPGASGNVGIGTTNPSEKLHLKDGNILFEMNSVYGHDPLILFANEGNGANSYQTFYRWTGVSDHYYANRLYQGGNQGFKLQYANSTTYGNHAFTDGLVLMQNGNFGVGVSDPSTKLESGGTIRITSTTPVLHLRETDTPDKNFQIDVSGGNLNIRTNNDAFSSASTKVSIVDDGDVGIGTTDPRGKLHVMAGASNGLLRAITLENDDSATGETAVGISFISSNGTQKKGLIAFQRTQSSGRGDFIFALNNTADASDADLTHEVMRIMRTGNIGIGTTSPSEKLEVNGTIRSQEVKVEASPWPDYVFDPDYELRSLEETEVFIKENRHLPEIPSASELETSGLPLGEMNRLLMKKIEELTLHQIELKKENNKMKKEIGELRNAPRPSDTPLFEKRGEGGELEKKIEELTLHLIEKNQQINDLLSRVERLEKE